MKKRTELNTKSKGEKFNFKTESLLSKENSIQG